MHAIPIEQQIQIAKTPFLMEEAASRKPVIAEGISVSFTIDELKQVLAKIKTGKAADPDYIPPEIVKALRLQFPEYVLKIWNQIVVNGKTK